MLIPATNEKQVSSAVSHKLTLAVEQCLWWQWHYHISCHSVTDVCFQCCLLQICSIASLVTFQTLLIVSYL